MRTFFFSILLFILFISGVRQLQANTPKNSDFSPQSFTEEKSSSTKKIKISGKALRPENVLIKEGDRVQSGQPLITRKFEIDQLESQRSKILERIQFLETKQPIKPIEPIERTYPALPEANFEAESLRLSAISARCDRLNLDLEAAKNTQLSYLSAAGIDKLERSKQHKARELNQAQDLLVNLKSLNFQSHYITHQEEKIKKITEEIQQIDSDILVETGKLQERLSLAEIQKNSAIASVEEKLADCNQQLQIFQANLLEAKYKREILEQDYQRSLAIHLQEQNRNQQNYQRDLVKYNESVESQKLALFQANEELTQTDLRLSEITEIKSPYDGEITRIKILNSVDGFVNVEFTLVYR